MNTKFESDTKDFPNQVETVQDKVQQKLLGQIYDAFKNKLYLNHMNKQNTEVGDTI